MAGDGILLELVDGNGDDDCCNCCCCCCCGAI